MASTKMHRVSLLALFAFSAALSRAFAQQDHAIQAETPRPWMNQNLSPDERAELALKQMTLDEKIDPVHGQGMPAAICVFFRLPEKLRRRHAS